MKLGGKIIVWLLFFILIILILGVGYWFFHFSTPQFSSFKGNAEVFWFQGQNSDVNFKAYRIFLTLTNTTDFNFNSVKNIMIEYSNGEKRSINNSYNIEIRHYKDQSLSLSNVDIGLHFGNLTMTKRLDQTYLDGTISFNYIISSGGKVDVSSSSVDDVSIGDEKVTNFNHIIFEMDKESSITFSSEISKLQTTPVYDLNITSQLSKMNLLSQGEGVLNLESHNFDIKGADYLYIELLPIQSSLVVKDTKIIFIGFSNLAKLNNKDIIMSEGFYWYDIKPEALFSGINAFAVVFLVIATILLAYFNMKLWHAQDKPHLKFRLEKSMVVFANGTPSPYVLYIKNIGKGSAFDINFQIDNNPHLPIPELEPQQELQIDSITPNEIVLITKIIYKDINELSMTQKPITIYTNRQKTK